MIDSFGLSAEYLHVDDSLIKQHIVETSRRVYGKSKRQKDRLCCRPSSQTFTPKKTGPGLDIIVSQSTPNTFLVIL